MTDAEFMDLGEAALRNVEFHCDRINDAGEADIDNQRVGGMVTLGFPNNSQIVINLQKPLHEIWMASKSGGYHYRWSGSAWLDTKSQVDLWEQLSEEATAQGGRALRFNG